MKRLLLCALLFAACEHQPAPVVAPNRQPTPESTVALVTTTIIAPAPSPTAPPDADEDMVVPVPTPEPPKEVLVATPLKPVLTKDGHALILEFETGGIRGYNPHPERPPGASGITIGIGADLGYTTVPVFESDWSALADITVSRLKPSVGLTGERAQAKLSSVRDIIIGWDLATDVFDNVDVARWWAQCRHALSGFDELRPNAQAALVSLAFNRGLSMMGGNRLELRNIRDYGVPKQDYTYIAKQIRAMERIWRGTAIERGMIRRREAEARLVETP